MEQAFRAIALIRNAEIAANDGGLDGGTMKSRWLLKWEPDLRQWRFFTGERLEKESFRETVVREVAWQTGLNRQRDFLVAHMAQHCTEFIGRFPDEDLSTEEKHIALAFYGVEVYRQSVVDQLTENAEFRWATSAEVGNGQFTDGEIIDPRFVYWNRQWRIINHCDHQSYY